MQAEGQRSPFSFDTISISLCPANASDFEVAYVLEQTDYYYAFNISLKLSIVLWR